MVGFRLGDGSIESRHRGLVDVVDIRDASRAAATMEEHMLRGKERFLSAAADQLER
jgi:DNA-binding GntR family transcriptional regulator